LTLFKGGDFVSAGQTKDDRGEKNDLQNAQYKAPQVLIQKPGHPT
jgi:hypothetical protein